MLASFLQMLAAWIGTFANVLQERPPQPTIELIDTEDSTQSDAIRAMLRYVDCKYTSTLLPKSSNLTKEYDQSTFKSFPALWVDDVCICQPKSILRYVSRLGHAYPVVNPVHMALVDSWLELHTSFATMTKKQAALVLDIIADELRDADWLGDFEAPTVADFCWAPTLEALNTNKQVLHDYSERFHAYLDDRSCESKKTQ